MCVTNTVRRRAVAKLPAHALGGGSIAKAAPYTTSSSALTKVPAAAAAAQVRRQQEEAQQLLLRRKAIVASSSSARGGHAAAAFAAAAATGGKSRAKSKKEEKEKESHETTAAAKSGKVSPPTAPPSSSTEVQQPATGCEAAPKPSPPPSSSGAGKGTTDSSSSPYEHGTVTHSYHDHAADADTKARGVTRGGVTHPFPLKLHGMLDVAIERDGLGHVVSWQPHGRAFLVHNTKMFVDVVMPKYFKQTKMASFQRQLNLYGFQRITAGMDRGAYYHELFLRGMPFLAAKMQRTRVKGTGVRMASSPETEPNFYAMKPVNAHKICGGGGGVLGGQGLALCLGHHEGATAAQVEAATVAAKAAAAQLSLQRRQQHCDGGTPTSPPRHPPPLQIAPSPNLGAAVVSAVSGSALQSLLINPLATAQQSSQKASLKEALSVISPVPPHHPALLPAVVSREGNSSVAAATMTAAGTVVTPCSAHHKPSGKSLKDLQSDCVSVASPTDAALKAVVPPPPLALPGKALKPQEQRPSPAAPQRGIELEHFIHRPRPPPPSRNQEEDKPQEEYQDGDSKSNNDRTFERSVLQYLDSMHDDDNDDNKDFKDAAARTIVDVVEDLASMEPLPFRPVQGPSFQGGGGVRLQLRPDKMDLPRRDFVPPMSPIRGSSNARRHSNDDASSTSSSSSSCASPAAAVHPEPSEKSPEKKCDDVEDVLKHHGRFDDLDIDIGGMDQYQLQDQDQEDVLDEEVDEDDGVASIPKHLLSPKSKEAEMDRFLEELFQKSSCGGGGGKMFLDPLDPDDGMRLDDEALGYLLDEVVAGE